jgi:hypothetical protein
MVSTENWPGRIIAILIIMGLVLAANACAADISRLEELVVSFEDPKMSADDLAFYLMTHNYDAKPVDGYVELKTDGSSYKLVHHNTSFEL